MKQNITLCLDPEVIELLEKSGNKSQTTNGALIRYFGTKKPAAVLVAEKITEGTRLFNEADAISNAAAQAEQARVQVFDGVPDEVLADFKNFPALNEDSLTTRWRDIYKKRHEAMSLARLLDAFRKYKGGVALP